MKMNNDFPDWVVSCFRVALLGEIYPSIRAIAVKYEISGKLLIRYYLDREPSDFDRESIEVVATNFEATSPHNFLKKIDVECVFYAGPANRMEALDGFMYARREYEM